MKRFLLFVFSDEPNGGWHDFQGAYDKCDEAQEKAQELAEINRSLSYHIYDIKSCQLVICKENSMSLHEVNTKRAVRWK